jgi:hypothetical protein
VVHLPFSRLTPTVIFRPNGNELRCIKPADKIHPRLLPAGLTKPAEAKKSDASDPAGFRTIQ